MEQETIDRYSSHLARNPEDRKEQMEAHRQVRENFAALDAKMLDLLPDGEAKEMVVLNLEQAAMWANKAVASPYPLNPNSMVEGTESQDAGLAQSTLFSGNFQDNRQ